MACLGNNVLTSNPLAALKCMSDKRRSELAGLLELRGQLLSPVILKENSRIGSE